MYNFTYHIDDECKKSLLSLISNPDVKRITLLESHQGQMSCYVSDDLSNEPNKIIGVVLSKNISDSTEVCVSNIQKSKSFGMLSISNEVEKSDLIYLDAIDRSLITTISLNDLLEKCNLSGFILFDNYVHGDRSGTKMIDKWLCEVYGNYRVKESKNYLVIQKVPYYFTEQDVTRVPFYITNHINEERRERMRKRMMILNLTARFNTPVSDEYLLSYSRMKGRQIVTPGLEWSCMFNVFDNMKEFVDNSVSDIAIFLEDDVYIDKSINERLPMIIKDFKEMNLEILLLGAFFQEKPELDETRNNYIEYDDGLWGSFAYLIKKDYAKKLIEKYTIEFVRDNMTNDTPFSPDWIITKKAERRRLLFPPLAVEEGVPATTNPVYVDFHRNCKNVFFSSEKYI